MIYFRIHLLSSLSFLKRTNLFLYNNKFKRKCYVFVINLYVRVISTVTIYITLINVGQTEANSMHCTVFVTY